MAYLKGGTVVDGNLYVEGSVIAKKEGSEEGTTYLFTKKPEINKFVKFSDTDGQTVASSLSEVYNNTDNRLEIDSSLTPVYIKIQPSDFSMKYEDTGDPNGKLCLTSFNKNGERIQEIEFMPIDTPEYWGYDDTVSIVVSGTNKEYTIPNEAVTGVKEGKTVLVSGTMNE